MKLFEVVLRRLASRIIEFAGFLIVTTSVLFFILRASGNPVYVLAGINSSPAQLAAIDKLYGFNKPLVDQYWIFMSKALRFNFGTSLSEEQPALHLVLQHLLATVGLVAAATALYVIVSVPAGCWLGSAKNRVLATGGMFTTFTIQAIPFYVTGLVLIQLFVVKYHVFQSVGDSQFGDWVLPTITLASLLAPRLTCLIAAAVRDELGSDYVRVARAMGSSQREIILREVLPNALLAAIAFVSTQFGYLISGTLIVEAVFAWPGVGQLLIQSVTTLDFPVLQAAVAVIAIFVYVGNALGDVLITAADPRLRR